MRHSGNIFETESYRGTGIRTVSGATVVAVVLGVISFLAAIFIIANFGDITARIAIWMSNFLSSGFLLLSVIVVTLYFVAKLKWKMRRHFWDE